MYHTIPSLHLFAEIIVRAEGGADIVPGEAFVPEVYYAQGSSFRPICGHHFWNNDNGATTMRKCLGFHRGTVVASGAAHSTDSIPVGACHSGEALDMCTGGK
jgi:hypothetical protein